jgi:fumarylacetoacetate (FAA) hydrolase
LKLCTFTRGADGPRPGRIVGAHVERLRASSLIEVLAVGSQRIDTDAVFTLNEVRLLAPVPEPPAVRDFYAFEAHVATARANRGASVPPQWYEMPVFYFSNPAAIYGPDDAIPLPLDFAPTPTPTVQFDYELEVAGVIGAEGRIAGFTIMNDWSARDFQAREVAVGLGPAKGKDFATSMGPVLVTVDEFDGTRAEMVARVNGDERSRGNLADIHYKWDTIVRRASINTRLRPGDIIGSGTVGTGCILEHGDGRWLQVDDLVELEIEGIGILRNTVAPPSPAMRSGE